jgi:hypothetical protein
MNPVGIYRGDDPGTMHIHFRFRGRDIGVFEVSSEFVANDLDADPRLDPFEVIEALGTYLEAYRAYAESRCLDIVKMAYGNHKDEIMSLHLWSELERYTDLRADLELRLREAMDTEADIRNELQNLPVNEKTAPANRDGQKQKELSNERN